MPARKKTRGALRSPATRKPRRRGEADRTAEFETTLRESAAGQRYQLRLYVSGTSPRSGQAIANVRLLCDEFLFGRYDLEVIDIYQQPGVASREQIIAAPTLIKINPEPVRRLIGDLSDRNKVLAGLNLAPRPSGNALMEL